MRSAATIFHRIVEPVTVGQVHFLLTTFSSALTTTLYWSAVVDCTAMSTYPVRLTEHPAARTGPRTVPILSALPILA
jgi:hypothetical protein